MMNKFQLILDGKIDEALALYTRDIENDFSSVTLIGRGRAYLYLNELDKALADFEMAAKIREQVNLGPTDGHLQMIGVTLWLKGKEQEAADVWNRLVQDHLADKIEYSDRAGGVESGNLLWYAASFEKFRNYRKQAEKLLKKKSKHERIKYWPGPVAQYLLGNMSEDDLILTARKSNREKRYLCEAYFYIGARALSKGDKKHFRKAMADSVATGPPNYVENEFYLARYELARTSE
ncbi:MAG: hypothetical protein ACYC0Q_15125 [Eubacteriales bacterium]